MAKRRRPKGATTKGNPAAGPAEAETTSGTSGECSKRSPGCLAYTATPSLFNYWLADHPDHTEVPQNVKAILFNVKSLLRKKGRKKVRAPHTVERAEHAVAVVTQPKPLAL
jgi:hypothetical protein